MNLAKIVASGCASLLFSSVVACSGGAGGESGFAMPESKAPATPSDPSAPGSTLSQGGGGSASSSAPATDLAACATATASATPKPVYLVFAYDQSGSMAGSGKWTAANAAMKGFFSSPDADGLHASMTLFPKYEAYPTFCNQSEYEKPDVAVTTLPSAVFASALDATAPEPGKGGTPTMAALAGAMTYAKQLAAGVAKGATIAVVMVTDGVPEVCSDKGDVGPAALVAAANASEIPTYVVGVGSNLANLDTIAFAGGTTQAFVVSVGDPTKTQTDLTDAIDSIKTSTMSCDYAIPAAPDGQKLDPAKLNVQYTPPGGAAQSLGYDQACASGQGWRYDDATSPTRVLACAGTCGTIKKNGGKVDMVFGCATQREGVK